MTALAADRGAPSVRRRQLVLGVGLVVLVAVPLLLWAKWAPYLTKVTGLAGTHAWSGSNILTAGGVEAGDAPSWHAATSFLGAYWTAIWRALVAAIAIGAVIRTVAARRWLTGSGAAGGPWRAAVTGAAAGTPSMMCTCCAAPVAANLRREGASTAATVAYWLGNPLLNPAVLAFLALAAPWQWFATRLVVGLAVTVGGAVLVARLAGAQSGGAAEQIQADPPGWRPAARRTGSSLARAVLVMVPEYLGVVLLVGACRGWLLSAADGSGADGVAVWAVLAAVGVGTLLVVPTGGEIAVLLGLAVLPVPHAVLGALLITLPAVSLPSLVMLARPLGARIVGLTAAVVAAGGVLGGVVFVVL